MTPESTIKNIMRTHPNPSDNVVGPIFVISGGQTGVDCAALAAAVVNGYRVGGYAPRFYRTESKDPVFAEFSRWCGLIELKTNGYVKRTLQNVLAGHATCIYWGDKLARTPGTLKTERIVREKGKTLLEVGQIADWVKRRQVPNDPLIVNFAGPRESKSPGIFYKAFEAFDAAFKEIKKF